MESESLSWNTAELKDLRVLREIYIYTFFSKKTTKKKSSLGFCNALSWVLRARSSRKLSETSSLKASATSVSKISATLAIATAFCRFNPNLFASFYNFFFRFDFMVRVSISNGICISSRAWIFLVWVALFEKSILV